jgi:dihydroorotate dehydrogenase (NAD+) catalytic subunit
MGINTVDLGITLCGIKLNNPVMTASGTFGYGNELSDVVSVGRLGAIITKTITARPTKGNPPPRICEVTAGMLNTIGLQNIGVEKFISTKLSLILKLGVPVIVSVAGETVQDFVLVVEALNKIRGISAIELNLSCPNLQKKIICQDKALVGEILKEISKISRFPVIAKLSPSVSDIQELTLTVEESGAHAISLVNTFPGMAIDTDTWKPKLSTVTGGFSGPAIKPLALRCVWLVSKITKLPVIGGGGIISALDAVEFLLAGASAVSVGTANFIKPGMPLEIIEGIKSYLEKKNISSVSEIVGKVKIFL